MADKKQKPPIWLTLSNVEDINKALTITDLFQKGGKQLTKGQFGQLLWTTLLQAGIQLHSDLENQYYLQKICLWDGGVILEIKGSTEGSYEARCADCTYIYKEE